MSRRREYKLASLNWCCQLLPCFDDKLNLNLNETLCIENGPEPGKAEAVLAKATSPASFTPTPLAST